MLARFATMFKPATEMQDTGKMRENDDEDSRKVTPHQDKVCVQRLEPLTPIAVIPMLSN